MEINTILSDISARRSFLMGLVFMAKADGVLDPEEMAFFHNAAVAMELDEPSIQQINACWNAPECPPFEFSNSVQKKFFIREAIELSCIDNNYSEEEKALVREFATTLGVSLASVAALEAWVAEGLAWKKRGDELVYNAE